MKSIFILISIITFCSQQNNDSSKRKKIKEKTVYVYDIKKEKNQNVKGFKSDSYKIKHNKKGKPLYKLPISCMNCDTVWLNTQDENENIKTQKSGDTIFYYMQTQGKELSYLEVYSGKELKLFYSRFFGIASRYSKYRYNENGDVIYFEVEQARVNSVSELTQINDPIFFKLNNMNFGQIYEHEYVYH